MNDMDAVTANQIINALLSMRNEEQQRFLVGFFKTGEDEYGHGDRFIGLKTPQTRMVAKAVRLYVSFAEIEKLLHSEWHEARLCGLLLLIEEMHNALPKHNDTKEKAERRERIAQFYLRNARQANNWDLVDISCPKILGHWLLHPLPDGRMPRHDILDRLAASRNLWEQRISIVTTWMLIRHGLYADTLRISDKLLAHPNDLIHKAVGWMLREVGKKDIDILEDYLETHYRQMHRTTLRYAIEKMDEPHRIYWLRRR